MPKLIGSRLFSRRFPLSIRNLVALNAKSALLRCIAAQQKLSPQDDTNIADLHRDREKGARDYIWHLFDRLEDLRPILK